MKTEHLIYAGAAVLAGFALFKLYKAQAKPAAKPGPGFVMPETMFGTAGAITDGVYKTLAMRLDGFGGGYL